MPNLYATLAELKARLRVDDANDDAPLLDLLETASRQVDDWTGHVFYVSTAARAFPDPTGEPWTLPSFWRSPSDTMYRTANLLLLPAGQDLLAVTAFETDPNGDRSYGTSWSSATDYDLLPANAASASPPAPYHSVARRPTSSKYFPTWPLSTRITGRWGYYQVLARSSATVAEVLDTTETGVDVSNGALFSPGHTLLVDSEQLYVTAVVGNTLTVTRAVNGTTAATHSNGAAIDVYTYPLAHEATLMQAARLWGRRDSPFGVVGAAELGTVQVAPFGATKLSSALDPDARALLQRLRVRGVA